MKEKPIMRDFLDISGQWEVFLDPNDQGLSQQWFQGEYLKDKNGIPISLPGSLEQAGIGDPVTAETQWIGSQFGTEFVEDPLYAPYHKQESFRFPYWLQPQTRYLGPAWYVRHVTLPEIEGVHHWQLFLERPHWETRVWANGVSLGRCDSLSVPHRYTLEVEGSLTLVIRIDNRMLWEVGPNAHSISDQTQGPWNGMVGKLGLEPISELSFGDISLYPDVQRKSFLARIEIKNHMRLARKCKVSIRRGSCLLASLTVLAEDKNTVCNLEVQVPKSSPWDEFTPNLSTVEVELSDQESSMLDQRSIEVGLREISTQGKHLVINQKKVFLRGTVECCVFPKTGAPPMHEKEWEQLFEQAKAFGLNHIRFHSWCPPEAAFKVADRMGFYLQVECPIWKNQGVAYDSNTAFDNWLFIESERIVTEYGNHPSFLLFASGNEPDGRHPEILGLWTAMWNQRDGRRLHTAASGWPALEENAFHVLPEPRIQAWGEGLNSRINSKPPETCSDYDDICENNSGPIVTHETGQWCVFPDFSEIKEYTGYLKPKNFEIFSDILRRRGIDSQAKTFLQASGKLQVLCYKEELESALRTKNLAGFQLLGLTDFPGQGTALVGVLNAFWQEKGYCTSNEFRRFCNDIVLLARLQKRFYSFGEELDVDIELSNYGQSLLDKASITWKLCTEDGRQLNGGTFLNNKQLERGLHSLFSLSLSIPELGKAQKLTLSVALEEPSRENFWDIWVFPRTLELDAPEIVVTKEWGDEARQAVSSGKKVLLMIPPQKIDTEVALGFSSVFWNTSWTNGQAPHTLGLVCEADHPVFDAFPTQDHSDWQWWELVHGASAMVLDKFPQDLKPLVQPIDTWFRSHKLGLLFECKVGLGKLMVCSMDLSTELERRLVARQLLYSLLMYMESDGFVPSCKLTAEEIGTLFI